MQLTRARFTSLVLLTILLAHLVVSGLYPISSEDTWWHLKQGEIYVAQRSLPSQDPFAFTTAGREWVHYSWMADVLFYLVYRAAGLDGLVLLRLTLFIALALALFRMTRRAGLDPATSTFLVFLATTALRFRLLIRSEILAFGCLALVLFILIRLPSSSPRTAWLLLPVQIAWINLHGSALFGIGLPALAVAANVAPAGWASLPLDRARRRQLALVVAALPFASLVTPDGAAPLIFPFRQNRMMGLEWLTEWQPLWHLPASSPLWRDVVLPFTMLVLLFLAVSLTLVARERRLDLVGAGILLAMGTYACFRNRAVPYFVIAILPFLALARVRLGGRARYRRAAFAAAMVAMSASVVGHALPSSAYRHGFGVRPGFFPEGAAAFLERNRLDGRLFNAHEFGGYLIWRRWPANQVFIDGRYDGVLFSGALLEDYVGALRSRDALDTLADRYGIGILVTSARPERHMASLDENAAWARVYWDPVAEVYVRRVPEHAALIARSEYQLTGAAVDAAHLTAYRSDPASWNRALGELRRAVRENPANAEAWLALAQEYRVAGEDALGERLAALDHLCTLLEGKPARARVHSERAEVLLALGRRDEAGVEARGALALDRRLVTPRLILATLAEHRADWGDARRQLRAALDHLEPGHPAEPEIRARLQAAETHLPR